MLECSMSRYLLACVVALTWEFLVLSCLALSRALLMKWGTLVADMLTSSGFVTLYRMWRLECGRKQTERTVK